MSRTLVLVHGLGRTSRSMLPLARAGQRRGYRVINHRYRSTRGTIEEHARRLRLVVDDIGGAPVHFVTHSLGGIVVRAMLADETHWPRGLGRVVMISPPNRGSELVDVLRRYQLYRWAMGGPGCSLGTGGDSLPNRLGPVRFELGVITGNVSLNPLFSRLIAGPSDGKVSIDRACVQGMRELLVVRRSHSFIMRAPEVVAGAFSFLETGRFGR